MGQALCVCGHSYPNLVTGWLGALSRWFRRRRMARFARALRLTTGTRILDIGGTPECWDLIPVRPRVVLLNTPRAGEDLAGAASWVAGDGRSLPFRDASFDIVFSNSVIEHVGDFESQQRFAGEVARVGRSYWVQTPNRWFPVEQHLLTPLVHWLPKTWQRRLVPRLTVWGAVTRVTEDRRRFYFEHYLTEVRLLDAGEVSRLFPGARVIRERFCGMTKSLIAAKFVVLLTLAICAAAQTSEFVAEPMPTPSCHASTIVEVKPGELMAAWFGGTGEGRPDVAIWSARKQGGKWQPPVELAREPNTPTWNPVLFRGPDQVLWFYYKFGTNPREWSAGRRFSRDDGRSWSPAEHLPAGIYGPVRAKPLVLPDGVIVSGTSVESYQSWAAWVERSTDAGKTWSRHGPIVPPTGGIIQPVVVPMEGRHLRFFARSNMGRICISDSYDEGVTWSAARATDMPNPSAGIDVVRMKDGRFVMIYNHTERGRTPLNLAVSADGDKWTRFVDLEKDPGEYSYPAMVQAADGSLHITYTWRREKIKYVNFPLASVPKP